MNMAAILSASGVGVFVSFAMASVHAAEIKVLAANGIQSVVEDLAPRFERASGHKLTMVFSTGGATVKRAQDGEAAEVLIAPAPGVETLVKSGKVTAGNVTAIASTGISVAMRRGAVKPDITTPEAFRRTMLAAKSITFLNPADGGASGIHTAKVLDRLGIAGDMKSKIVLAPRIDAVGNSVAKGEVEFGILQYQLLFAVPGIEIVGPLPGDLQDSTVFSAALLSNAKETEAARALIAFLRSSEAAAVIKAKGMEPVLQR